MDIDNELKKIEQEINSKAQNQAVEQQLIVTEQIPKNDITVQNNPQQMSEGQAKALLDTVSKPEGALGLHLAKSITTKVQEGAGKDRLEKTADKIIDSGLKTFEANADNDLNKAQKTAEDLFFDSKKVQLNRGGINKATSQRVMERVVKTDDIWSDINFYLFSWWVIGINNYFSNMKNFHWFFKCIINLLFTLPMICLIPVEFCIGVIGCIIHFTVIGISRVSSGVKELIAKIKNKKVVKDVQMVEEEDSKQENREDVKVVDITTSDNIASED